MPELPEVETIVRELRPKIAGKRFSGVEGELKYVFRPSFEKIVAGIKGLRVLDVERRGKFIVLVLEKKMRLVIHLRMSGRLLWKKIPGKEKHIRAIFYFDDGSSLIFSDMRKFGRIWFYSEKDYKKATGISRLGIEPFSPDFSRELLNKIFIHRRGILKNTLLRQDLIAGIGNIYADEICYRIGLDPRSRLENLRQSDVVKLFEAISHCLKEGIAHGGASISDFVGTRGTLGKHQHYLQVYGRKGDPCYACGGPIQKMKVAGRGTFVCVNCQVLR
jgi:formamidopyrimidine-DNA glycosylase